MASKGKGGGKGRKNWSRREIEQLLSLVRKNKSLLQGKFGSSGGTVTNDKKNACWKNVCVAVNAVGDNMRTVEQCKTKWRDIKSAALKELTAYRREREKTGGGSPPQSPSADARVVEEILGEDNEIIGGIVGGIESGASSSQFGLQPINTVDNQDIDDDFPDDLEHLSFGAEMSPTFNQNRPRTGIESQKRNQQQQQSVSKLPTKRNHGFVSIDGDESEKNECTPDSVPYSSFSTNESGMSSTCRPTSLSKHRGLSSTKASKTPSRDDLLKLEIERATLEIEVLKMKKKVLVLQSQQIDREENTHMMWQALLEDKLKERGFKVAGSPIV